ncbi:MAG: response regulator [Oscillospiraceae bacterium]|jgi:putative two-component system response regulator|nr:response regulator [Oscillospiraceae bacterium]
MDTCIFMVDDSAVNLNMGKSALQDTYTVVTIPSGERLLQLLPHKKPDLILLDVEMPGMGGYEVLEILKRDRSTANIPVIFLTGKTDPENELMGLSLGAVDYITKPFSPPLLLKRIQLHLQLESQKESLRMFNDNLLELVRERTDEVTALQNAVIKWAAELVEFRDDETGKHVARVQKYLQIMLDSIQKPKHYIDEITTWDTEAFIKSAMLHDVGKIKIRDDILLKPAKLNEDEYANVKLHALYGKILLESLQEDVPNHTFLEYAKTLAYRHHEKWDGTGYPGRLRGEEIPLQARMMALADVYDALISKRPYKEAYPHDKALSIIAEGRGTQFDPVLTDLFLSLSDGIKEIGSI